jgi:sporulation protein YlmC with PRC-barrel domain
MVATATQGMTTLVKMGDANLTVADPSEDIRGRKVLDKNGDEVAKVDDLMIDNRENKGRLLQVESGGFLGLGETTGLIPVDAITRITEDQVHISQTREHVARAPRYSPALANGQNFFVERTQVLRHRS